jgi:hypothetical protein
MLNPSGLEAHRERPIPAQIEFGDPRLREFTAPPPIEPPPPSHVRPSCIERMIVCFNDCCKTRKTSFLLGIVSLLFNGMLLAIYIIYYDEIQRSICESEFGSSSEIAREARMHQGKNTKRSSDKVQLIDFATAKNIWFRMKLKLLKDLLKIEIKYCTLSSFYLKRTKRFKTLEEFEKSVEKKQKKGTEIDNIPE